MKNVSTRFLAITTAVCLSFASAAHGQSIVQLGLIIDASSSTEEELPTFRQGVADAIATLKTDASLELTLIQFSAEGKVIFGPAKMDAPAVRQQAIDAVLALDPDFTAVPPFTGGTNIEDAFLETLLALQASPNAGEASLQFINMLTDGHPTSHNHLNLSDVDALTRHQRGQTFAKEQRDALVTAGIDVISFEALGSSAEDIEYLKTLAYPEPAVVIDSSSSSLVFPSPITAQGFLLPIATVEGIGAALTAKFEAAGFAIGEDPDPLEVDDVRLVPGAGIQFTWTGRAGLRYQIEYTNDLKQWLQDLPNSLLTTALAEEVLTYLATDISARGRYYRIVSTRE